MARDTEQMLPALCGGSLKDGDRITGVSVLSAGHSNDTFLLEGLDRVLRTPPSERGPAAALRHGAASTPCSAAVEARTRPRCRCRKVYELEEDVSVIGAPFFVMERLSGEAFEYAVPDWLASRLRPALPDAMCRQWFEAVAALQKHGRSRGDAPRRPFSVSEEAAYWLEGGGRRRKASQGDDRRCWQDLAARPPQHLRAADAGAWRPQARQLPVERWWASSPRSWTGRWRNVSEPLLDLGYILMFHDQGEASLANAGFDLPGWWSPRQMIDFWEQALGRTAVDIDRYAVLAQAKISAIISLGAPPVHHRQEPATSGFGGWGVVLPAYVNRLLCRARHAKAG